MRKVKSLNINFLLLKSERMNKKLLSASIVFILTIFLLDISSVLADTGLVANYHFSEGSGITTADSSGNGNIGTLVNSPTWTSGVIGNASSYNSASSQFVKILNSPSLNGIATSIVSVAAWVKTSSATDQVIFSTWGGTNGYQLWLNNGIPAIWSNGGGTLVASSSIADGSWHYVVGVWDGTNAYVYVDGVLKASGARTFSPSFADNQIGTQCSGVGSTSCSVYFNGVIDEVRIYSRVLNSTEIQNAFNYNVCSSGCEFDNIQDSINAANAGNTANVGPGTYTEQLTISKNITLVGSGVNFTIIQAPAALTGNQNIISISGSSVNADISKFTIQGPVNGLGSGISVQQGAFANIHNNQILNISDNPMTGAQHGWGIIVGASQFRVSNYQPYFPLATSFASATIQNNVISGYQKNGIIISNTSSNALINGNVITGVGVTDLIAQNGIVVEDGANATVASNIISNNLCDHSSCGPDPISQNQDGGILILNSPPGLIVSSNTFFNNDMGIFSSGNMPIIQNNNLTANKYEGIVLSSFNLMNANGTLITGNKIVNNGNYGIYIDTPVTKSLIYNNFMFPSLTGLTAIDNGPVNSNQWNTSTTGNMWSDFFSNPGHTINVYNVAGTANSVDYHPLIPLVVYVDSSYNSTNAGGHTFGYDAFNKIQNGTDAVASGGSVFVNSGNYTEQLTINKNLTLSGASSLSTTILAPSFLVGDVNGSKNIVTIIGPNVNVDFSKFNVSGPGPSTCGSINTGIFVRDGAYANIHDTTISHIRDQPLSGCQNGIGILVGKKVFNTTGLATIQHNLIVDYQKGGIVVDNAGSSAKIIINNVIGVGNTTMIAQNGIQISNGAIATVTYNFVSGNECGHSTCGPDILTQYQSVGILLNRAGNGTVVSLYNTVNNNDVGIYSIANKTNIYNNIVNSNRYGGIVLDSSSDSNTIQSNTIKTSGGYAIYLNSGVTNSLIFNNVIFPGSSGSALDNGNSNKWNSTNKGNYWSDWLSNPGYAKTYNIPGTAGSKDYFPRGPIGYVVASANSGTLVNIRNFTSFTSYTTSFTTTDLMSNGKLTGVVTVSITATTTAGETIKLISYGTMKQSNEFDSSRVYLNGTGTAIIIINRPGKIPLIYTQTLNSIRFDIFGSGSGVNVVGVNATAYEVFRISNMALTKYSYKEVGL